MSRKTLRNKHKEGINPTFSFSNAQTQMNQITGIHQYEDTRLKMLAKLEAESKELSTVPVTAPSWSLDKAIQACIKRIERFYKGTSKYQPHQGKQEVARRLARMQPALA